MRNYYYPSYDAFIHRDEVMKDGRIFAAYNHLHSANVRGKNIIKTGEEFVVSVHYLKGIRSVEVDKNVLSLAEYRKRWRNDSFVIDERMKRYTPYMMQKMKMIQQVYCAYFNHSRMI